MPQSRAYKARRNAIRKNNRNRGRYRAKNSITRAMPGFPVNNIVKMRYVDTCTLNPGVGGLATYQFRANSIFDPDLTGIGHQPLGHDEWAPFYNHYVVTGSKITATFTYDDGNANANYLMGCYLSDDGVVPLSGLTICEQGLGRYATAAAVNYAPVSGNSSQNSPSIVNHFSAKKFYNIKDVADNVVRIGAPYGSNPGDTGIYTVWTTAMDPLIDLGNVIVLVTIEYTVRLSEPRSLTQS